MEFVFALKPISFLVKTRILRHITWQEKNRDLCGIKNGEFRLLVLLQFGIGYLV